MRIPLFRIGGVLWLTTQILSAQTLQTSPALYPLPNDAVYGTVADHLAKFTNGGQVTILARSDTAGIVGVVRSGAGKTGMAAVAIAGQTNCAFDGPTTAGHYVQASGLIAGDCHDAGAGFPVGGQVLGRVLGSQGTAATVAVFLAPEVQGVAGGGGTNATALAGVSLAGSALQDGQTYVFDASTSQLLPAAVPRWKKYSVSYTQLTGLSGNTGTVVLFARAARQKLCGVSTYITAAYIAPGLTQMSLTVGDSNGTTNQYTPIAKSVLDSGGADFNVMGSPFGSANVTATFTASGAALSALTAGVVDIDICVVNEP